MPSRPRLEDAGPAARGGVLVVDKPAGPTSHDIVAVVRRRFRGEKVGHTGTLDPFATGVLPVVIGRATRLARYLSGADKEYDALIRLGRSTDTCDVTGTVVHEAPEGFPIPSAREIAEGLGRFRGTWMQTPPAYSAKRSGGVRAYEQARRGASIALAPVEVTVSDLELVSVEGPLVRIRLVSSAGFYVRALAHDLGLKLGTGGTLEGLRRLRSGPFSLGAAVPLEAVVHAEITAKVVPLEALLTDRPAVTLTREGSDRVAHGRDVGPAHCGGGVSGPPAGAEVRLLDPAGRLLAIAAAMPGGVLRPAVVLV